MYVKRHLNGVNLKHLLKRWSDSNEQLFYFPTAAQRANYVERWNELIVYDDDDNNGITELMHKKHSKV